MSREKQVSIPVELWKNLILYHLCEQQDYETEKKIRNGIESKIERMSRHELYTRYKSGETEEEKEKARLAYLDSVGVHKDFRW